MYFLHLIVKMRSIDIPRCVFGRLEVFLEIYKSFESRKSGLFLHSK